MMMKRLALLGSAMASFGACSKLPSNDANTTGASSNSTASTPAAAATRVRGVVQSIAADALALNTKSLGL
jgi:hypothetical protein